jgi:glycosyltransferase involved in cell wall biosynthesis
VRILYVWDADYPWDVRVEKICCSLAAAGHGVHVIARNLERRPREERLGSFQVHRLDPTGGGRVNYALSFPAFFNPFWARRIGEVIRTQAIELLVVRDLPLLLAGLRAGRRHGLPVVFDMAEDYVSMLANVWRHQPIRPLNVLVRNPFLARRVERWALPRVDHTLVVVEEAREVVRRAGGAVERTTIVSNTPRLADLTSLAPREDATLAEMRERFSAIYVGGIRRERGLHLVLDALERLVPEQPDWLFVAIGEGNALGELQRATRARRLERHVRWLGWREHREALGYVAAARVGVITNFASPHTDTTIPNKLFDYMGLGVPVIASDAAPLRRVVNETRCGEIFRSGDAFDLARALRAVRAGRVEYGANGRAAVRAQHHWGMDEARLLAIDALTGSRRA